MRITAVRRWLAGTRLLVTFLRNGIRPERRVAYCQPKESGDFAIGVDLSGQAPCHQGYEPKAAGLLGLTRIIL